MVIPATNTSVRISGPYHDPRDRKGRPWCVTVKRGAIVHTERFPYRDDAARWLTSGAAQAFQASLRALEPQDVAPAIRSPQTGAGAS